ncbi:carbon-nitrogen hydrolase family protein [Sphaerimonospora sp. CA-214678]|uniref:carbon-nitrogen hydrolase family protein n=1 Tax=Sphaerimonospora sp. CA-214678 TaxID=3240029 RepID=UPI003D90AFCA
MRVAAVHQSPVLLDRAATLDKVVAAIAEAGAADVRLLGFPETFVPGYPYWLAITPFDEQGELNRRYAEESVRLTAQALGAVGRACARHRVNVVLGVSERHGGTLYNTQVFIDDQGEVAGVHRKLQPTLVERAIWGQGDGSTLGVHALGVGRVGGLICGEHSMNLARQALVEELPEFHVGAWPGGGAVRSLDDWFRGHIWALSRVHAYTAGCFVIAAADPMSEANLSVIEEAFGPQPKLQTGGAISLILDPWGNVLARHEGADERLVIAEADLSVITEAKLQHDSSGHSARPEILRLEVDTRSHVRRPGPAELG